jgi:hypothetical protein
VFRPPDFTLLHLGDEQRETLPGEGDPLGNGAALCTLSSHSSAPKLLAKLSAVGTDNGLSVRVKYSIAYYLFLVKNQIRLKFLSKKT